MRKKMIFMAIAAMIIPSLALAQSSTDIDHTLEFVDNGGNVIADGSTITRSTIVADAFEGNKIDSELFVKNTTEGEAFAGMITTIVDMQSGSFQHCFPSNCKKFSSPITNTTDAQAPSVTDAIKAGEKKSLQSEWFVEDGTYGTATVTYQIVTYYQSPLTGQLSEKAKGAKITVNYVYADPANVDAIQAEEPVSEELFDLQGRKVAGNAKGVILKKSTSSNGYTKAEKIFINH